MKMNSFSRVGQSSVGPAAVASVAVWLAGVVSAQLLMTTFALPSIIKIGEWEWVAPNTMYKYYMYAKRVRPTEGRKETPRGAVVVVSWMDGRVVVWVLGKLSIFAYNM